MKKKQQHHANTKPRLTTDETSLPLSKTRVCIKNLPSRLVEERELMDFVRQQLPASTIITDCRILHDHKNKNKSRRMAFCGFATASQAAACIERLNKAYCKTARLLVEYARQLPTTTTTTSRQNNDDDDEKQHHQQDNNERKKETKQEDDDDDDKVNRRKQEFLAVMGVGRGNDATSGKQKFWANDEEHPPQEQLKNEQHDSSDSSSDSDDDNDENDSVLDDADPLQQPSKTDDMDFLRSKQVQRNDLDDPIQEQEQDIPDGNDHDNDNDNDDSSSDSRPASLPTRKEKDGTIDPKQQSAYGNAQNQNDTKSATTSTNNKNSHHDHQEPSSSSPQPAEEEEEEINNRLFLRNLPFSVQSNDLQTHFAAFGTVTECHLPADDQGHNKGFGFVTFTTAAHAKRALVALDGTDFQGRLLHILPARPSKQQQLQQQQQPLTGEQWSYKDRMEQERKTKAMSDTTGWSASFVRGDAVVDNLASRLGLSKGDIMAVKDGLSAGDAAVRLALAETAVIEENRKYFAEHGIDMEALVSWNDDNKNDNNTGSVQRSNTQILVKNLPHDTTKEELLKVFGGSGGGCAGPKSILLPPSKTIAVVEYGHGNDAKTAFRRLAYRRFKSVPLYLEWAPLAAIIKPTESSIRTDIEVAVTNDDVAAAEDDLTSNATCTLYIKNLNFQTSEEQLKQVFLRHVQDVRSVRIPKKAAPAKRSRTESEEPQLFSMGYGFVELGSTESARKALKILNGTVVDGHILEIKPSGSTHAKQMVAADSKKANCKLMIRNVPFQANRKELLQLFGSFGQLKKVRLPKKFDGTNRGFAFIEYLTGKEAAAAMKALSRTHLYGRHLVIEWAAADEDSERLDSLREKAERDVAAAPQNKKLRFDY